MATSTIRQFDPRTLPSVSLAEYRNLPRVPAVYIAFSDDLVLYVGRAVSLRARWSGHHRKPEISRFPAARIAYIAVRNSSSLPELERVVIETLRPSLNRGPVPLKRISRRGPCFCRDAFTTDAVARCCEESEGTVYDLIRDGVLAGEKIHGKQHISKAEFIRCLRTIKRGLSLTTLRDSS